MNRCQTCCNHFNNPSRCIENDEPAMYVGRKDPACKFYIVSPKKEEEMLRESALQSKLKAEKDSQNGKI